LVVVRAVYCACRGEGRDPLRCRPAADDDARDTRLGGAPGNAKRRLAVRGLGIDAALPGDDEICPRQLAGEVGRFHHEVHPGTKANGVKAVGEREQPETGPASGAGAGGVALRPARGRLEAVGPAAEAGVQLFDLRGGRALLRTVGHGRTRRTEERVLDVAGDLEIDLGEPRVEAAQVEALAIVAGTE